MQKPRALWETSADLWNYPGMSVALVSEENGYSCVYPDGLRLSCRISQEGTVCRRTDFAENTTDSELLCRDLEARFLFDGSDYEVYTQFSVSQNESVGAWQPLVTRTESCCKNARTSRNAAPMLALWDECANAGTVFHLIPRSTWRIGAAKIAETGLRHQVEITVSFAGDFTIRPHEKIKLPEVIFYDFRRKIDMDAWKLHRWFHESFPAKQMPVIYNSWMYCFDGFTPEGILSQIPKAAEIGAEYFVIDAGWFGTKGLWSKTVGDWDETPDSAMEGRLAEIADTVRENGMQFGLWLEPERAAQNSLILKEHPEYYITRGERSQFNYASEAARAYMLDTVDRLTEKYTIRYFKFDDNGDLFAWPENNQHIAYFEGYVAFLRELRRRHPDVYFEGCASGGNRMNLAAAIDYDSLWISDNQSHFIGMDIYKNTLLRMPPQVLERWAVFEEFENAVPSIKPPFSKNVILCADDGMWNHVESATPSWVEGFLLGSVMGFSCDLTKILPETFAQLKELAAQFKKDRAFWQTAECRILADTDKVLCLQYSDPAFTQVHLLTYLRRAMTGAVTVYPVLPGGEEKAVRIECPTHYSCVHTIL